MAISLSPLSTASPHTASSAPPSYGWWTEHASASVSLCPLPWDTSLTFAMTLVFSKLIVYRQAHVFRKPFMFRFWIVRLCQAGCDGPCKSCFLHCVTFCMMCMRHEIRWNMRLIKMSVLCVVCRYACHRKCCLKTISKCSKKVRIYYMQLGILICYSDCPYPYPIFKLYRVNRKL